MTSSFASRCFPRLTRVVLGSLSVTALWMATSWSGADIVAQAPPRPVTYTDAQADQGRAVYAEHCVTCHGVNLDDGAYAPPLKGNDFRQKWGSRPIDALFTYTRDRMPPAQPGTLGDSRYTQLLALLLQENGAPAGNAELPADPAALTAMASPGWAAVGGGGLAPAAKIPPSPPRDNPLEKLRPVTDAMLTRPPDADWLLWRRTYEALGFSPLKAIDKTNVHELRPAWSWALPNGPNQATPIVHDGVLFVHSYGDKVQALDAATGDLLWQYSRRLPSGIAPSIKRGISIFGSRLYVPTSDAHVVALDVKTGKVVWDQTVADARKGYRITGGTLVARGKVMIGTTGRAPGGNIIAALDAETGKLAWTFNTIAQPGESGGHTWNGLALEKRNGGSVWIPGSYDPVHGLAFFAPGNTYDTGPLRNPTNQPNTTSDALYLDSTLALDPDTGRLEWYFQHQNNGQWDLDWAFERQIVQLPVKGRTETVVLTAGKQMIFDLVEAESGKYLSSIDLGLQNLVTAIDPTTGKKTTDPNLLPGEGKLTMICPHVSGGRGWMPTSFDAATKVVYLPIVEACMDLVPVGAGERGSLSTGVRWTVRPRPDSDGNYGRLHAQNVESGKPMWVQRQRAPFTTGTLVTAGGLVFVGTLDRAFQAYDAANGTLLWKTRLNDVPSQAPISFAANGREYVAMVVGPGGYQSTSYDVLVPEIKNPPDHGATIWVFEVPARTTAKTSR
jgi:alcohol dehydrogenase (cytochrome c)